MKLNKDQHSVEVIQGEDIKLLKSWMYKYNFEMSLLLSSKYNIRNNSCIWSKNFLLFGFQSTEEYIALFYCNWLDHELLAILTDLFGLFF